MGEEKQTEIIREENTTWFDWDKLKLILAIGMIVSMIITAGSSGLESSRAIIGFR